MASKVTKGICCYCNKDVDTEKDDNFYSKTKRGSLVFFHGECYKRYGSIIKSEEWLE